MLHLMGHDSLPTFSYLPPSFSGVYRILAQLSLSCCLRLFYVSILNPLGACCLETAVGNMTLVWCNLSYFPSATCSSADLPVTVEHTSFSGYHNLHRRQTQFRRCSQRMVPLYGYLRHYLQEKQLHSSLRNSSRFVMYGFPRQAFFHSVSVPKIQGKYLL